MRDGGPRGVLRDAKSVEEGATVAADVCIVGAGPAGLTLALELASSDLDVALVEAGEEVTRKPSRRSAGSSAGTRYKSLREVRREGLGGTSSAWSAWMLDDLRSADGGLRCQPLQSSDFAVRRWVPNSGWPIGPEVLAPYYRRAEERLGLGSFAVEAPPESGGDRAAELALDPQQVETTLFRFAHHEVFHAPRNALIDSPRATVFLGGRVTELETGPEADRVVRAHVRSYRGGFAVRARWFVLAAGGIENAHLLLVSNRHAVAGLGNGHDLVGRFFMDHLVLRGAQLIPHQPSLWSRLDLYRRHGRAGVATLGALRLNEETRAREGLLGVVLSPFVTQALFTSESVYALQAFRYALRRRKAPEEPFRQLRCLLTDPAPAARSAMRVLIGDAAAQSAVLGLYVHFEQAPDRENRVRLSRWRDGDGLPRPKLHWRIGDREAQSVRRTLDLVDAELRKAGIGEIRHRPSIADVRGLADVTHHHMGTTRMHADPRQGVVDEHGKVHGVANLFVAGSSVFPTGGAATATMTLIALTLRLADRLRVVSRQ